MNSLVDDTLTETGSGEEVNAAAPLNAAGIPAPAGTHEDGGLPPVKPADDKKPVTVESLAGLVLIYSLNGNPAQWPCDTEPPKDVATLIAIRATLYGTVTFNRPTVSVKVINYLRDVTGRTLHSIQQGLPILNSRPVYDRERNRGRAVMRSDIITKTDMYIAGGGLDSDPLKISPSLNPQIEQAIRSKCDCNFLPILLHTARKQMAKYVSVFYHQWDKINWRDRTDEIKLELSNTSALTPERLEELRKELTFLEPSLQTERNYPETSSAQIIARAASAKVIEVFAPVKACGLHLLDNLAEVLEWHRVEAIGAEQEFFEAHGVIREPTPVSRRYDALIKSVRDQIYRLKNEPGHAAFAYPPNPHATPIIGTFGLEIIPGVL